VDPRPGLVIRALPRFPGDTLDSTTIEVNSGVIVKAGALWPKGDWRSLSEHETEILGLEPEAAGGKSKSDSVQNPDTLRIFAIPLHLLKHWQRISERFGSGSETAAGAYIEDGTYPGFVSQVVDFLRFKAVPLPNKCKFEMVYNFAEISPAVEVRTVDEPECGSGVSLSLLASEDVQVAVNLGSATSSLIFVNLSVAQMDSILGERGDPTGVSGCSKVERFFSCFPQYPCFRISLPPRMGYVLGDLATVHVRCPLSRPDPDLWLCVSAVPV
jgi:hypothetical protein